MDNDLIQVKSVANTVANQATYNLPADLITLRSVKWKGLTLQSLSLEEADHFITNNGASSTYPVGDVSHYWVFSTELNLYPAPSIGGADLLIYYTKQPTAIAEADGTPDITALDLPLQYHNAIVEYCLGKAYELDTDWQASDRKAQQYKDNIAELRGNSDDPTEFYPGITSLPEDCGYAWD